MDGTRLTCGAQTLAADYFRSPEIFAAEGERIFRRHWLCAGRASDFAEPGAFRLWEAEGESLLLLRDGSGQMRCYYNVCRHRGTRLCDADRGVLGNAICCPYHGWTYDLQGRLIAAPNMRADEKFQPGQFPLKAAAAAIWEGFVFVNLASDPEPLDEALRPLSGKLAAWRLSELAPVAKREYLVRANWKIVFQNFNECYHCPRVHPRLNAFTPFASASNDLREGRFLGGPMQLAAGVETLSRDGRLCGEVFPDLGIDDRRRVYYYSLFPTAFVSPHPDYVLVHRVERLDVAATRVVCELLFSPQSLSRTGFDPSRAVEFWDEVNRQDWRVCELSQQGVASRAYEPAPYSPWESIVAAFDRHYLQALEHRR